MAFGQIKDIYKLQKEARKMQKQMKKLRVQGKSKKEDVTVYVNGVQEIEDIEIADELLNPARKVDLAKAIKEAFQDANKRVQKEMMKDMDMDKMKSMLGGM